MWAAGPADLDLPLAPDGLVHACGRRSTGSCSQAQRLGAMESDGLPMRLVEKGKRPTTGDDCRQKACDRSGGVRNCLHVLPNV